MTKRKTTKLVGHAFDQKKANKDNGTELFDFVDKVMQRFLIITKSPEKYLSEKRRENQFNRFNRRVIMASILMLIQFCNVLRFAISALVNKVSEQVNTFNGESIFFY